VEIAQARDRFFRAHLAEAGTIVQRAIARSELAAGTDPAALIELVIGPVLLRSLFMGVDLDPPTAAAIVARAEAALVGLVTTPRVA
jgi:Tetracyclin repressor-like, C-terminal domain